MTFTLSRKTACALTCVYAAVLAAANLLPSGAGKLGGWDAAITPTLQNALHVPAFAVLMLLAAAWMWRSRRFVSLLWIALACFAFSLVLESAQAAIPGRMASPTDAALNLAGVVIAVVALMLWRRAGRAAPVSPSQKTV